MTPSRDILLLLSLFVSLNSLRAQGQEDVFPLLFGTEAQTAVADAYTPANVLSYGNARDTLFRRILSKNDSLTCIYSGHRVYMNPNEDPTTTVFQNGGTNGINTEHTWPQAYGAGDGDARSNMYHLFPTRIKVNAARANLAFGENPDQQTQTWYYLNQSQNNIPQNNIERYSEYQDGSFEPREDAKGDIARAMFYFYTIYSSEAGNAPANWFDHQISTLYQWHLQDPVTQEEWDRNTKIAVYQSNKSNPYILDSTLIRRVFCQQLQFACSSVATRQPPVATDFQLQVYPNPFQSEATIQYQLSEPGEVSLRLYSSLGQSITLLAPIHQQAGQHQINWLNKGSSIPTEGILFCQLIFTNKKGQFSSVKKIIHLP